MKKAGCSRLRQCWRYEDFSHSVSLPLMMKNGKGIGQELAHTLWEQAEN